jgi:hypothetical protein
VSVFSGEPRTYSTASVAAPNRFKSYRNRAATSSTRTNTVTEPSSYTRRGYKPRANNNPEGIINPAPSSAPPTINKFKLNRPAGRWQYKTSPKPRVTIRQQQNAPVKATTDSDLVSYCLLPPSLLFSPLVYALALCGVFVSVRGERGGAGNNVCERSLARGPPPECRPEWVGAPPRSLQSLESADSAPKYWWLHFSAREIGFLFISHPPKSFFWRKAKKAKIKQTYFRWNANKLCLDQTAECRIQKKTDEPLFIMFECIDIKIALLNALCYQEISVIEVISMLLKWSCNFLALLQEL